MFNIMKSYRNLLIVCLLLAHPSVLLAAASSNSSVCGNGMMDAGEECDDKNVTSGDGCSATCKIETGYACKNAPNINTGSDGAGGVQSVGKSDLVWSWSTTKGASGQPAIVAGNCAVGAWVTAPAGARWINRYGCGTTTPGNVDTFYTATFSIPNATSAGLTVLSATVWADNSITDVLVNGKSTGFTGSGFNGAGLSFGSWPSSLYKAGVNTMTVVVHNAAGGAQNPDGLLVSVPNAFGVGSVCELQCGDSAVETGETCDDGNHKDGDGCSGKCQVETGYLCVGGPSKCTLACGNGKLDSGETCDDGNTKQGDGCGATCLVETGYGCTGTPSTCAKLCGNGKLDSGETCDDGNAKQGDGCSATCTVETGYGCAGAPSVCAKLCGNGKLDSGETCDDGNANKGDGCSGKCLVEPGYGCAGTPSTCAKLCGNGMMDDGEECDDKNTKSGDGCSAACQIETGYACKNAPNLNTGSDNTGGVQAAGKLDLVWSWSATLNGSSQAATVAGNCAVGSWVTAPTGSRWINRYGCGTTTPENVDTYYTATFSIPNATSAGLTVLSATVWADNSITDVLVNGKSTGFTGSGFNGAGLSFGSWPSSLYKAGVNTMTVVVHNAAGKETNPDGLLVSVPNAFGVGSVCELQCGDGAVEAGETCDDGNLKDGDGCNNKCQIETGYLCVGGPSTCTFACGNGKLDSGEACDDGNAKQGDGCSDTCVVETGYGCAGMPSTCTPTCGNGALENGEACDDGNATPGDGCSETCTVETGYGCAGTPSMCAKLCGNGKLDSGETCDDGNATDGDGCGSKCIVEVDYGCTGTPSICGKLCGNGKIDGSEACDDGNQVDGDGCNKSCAVETGYGCTGTPSVCAGLCGDGKLDGGEGCDDGNQTDGDGCDKTCTIEAGYGCTGTPSVCKGLCGDGKVDAATEKCDDGNQTDGDGCDKTCAIEAGFGCTGSPSVCDSLCGDGKVDAATEKCDDGNQKDGDGCDKSCAIEAGYSCDKEPSVCNPLCGNGKIDSTSEKCDDGNATDGDGCDAACVIEQGYDCLGDPSVCTNVCGNGKIDGAGETCDDGNQVADDGCSATCLVESTFECAGTPSVCTPLCGNGTVDSGETCDDGNRVSGDGCDATCKPDVADADGDGILNNVDNCPDVANANQEDVDHNGIGDVCEAKDVKFFVSGGPCSASPTSSGPVGLLLLLSGAMALLLWRRRRAAVLLGLLLILGVTFAGTTDARAAGSQTQVDAQTFYPSPFMNDVLTAGRGNVGAHPWNLGLMANYQLNPLVLRVDRGGKDEIVGALVKHQVTLDLLAAMRFGKRFGLGIDVPVIPFQSGEAIGSLPVVSSYSLGDVRLYPRLSLIQNERYSVAVTAAVSLPTGKMFDSYTGHAGFTVLPGVLADLKLGRLRLAANASVILGSTDTVREVKLSNAFYGRFAAWYAVMPEKLDAIVELRGSAQLSGDVGRTTPMEVLVGATIHATKQVDVKLAGGAGLTSGLGSPDARVLLGIFYAPADAVTVVAVPVVPPPAPVDKDSDGDGLLDKDDKCPQQPEDKDGFEDEDGCPDPDNDADGICDGWVVTKGEQSQYAKLCHGSDTCPDVPEDKDGFEDEDGCPDPDNDHDKVCDKWVSEQGLQAKYAKICKGLDKCPDEPETRNGYQDDDGCPDQAVVVKVKLVVILQHVNFYLDKTKIKEESMPLLDEVVTVLKQHTELTKLRIEGHTDTRARPGYNLRLSRGRAKRVMDYLVAHGIAKKRLIAKGFGLTRPLIKNAKTEAEHLENRRVMFVILKRSKSKTKTDVKADPRSK